ncbi:alpha-L-fucosidase [Pedobacter sp. N36a]|uniref:alpha-L-fucosidase n=1 Tax=Pedobacter sp. N36a TaxID=2767996 RepID=UPI0016574E2E|nr:alpha-L-fucosidase [Pedobacter sp. N36a]MBC8984747.1 alpha-L-fucosidase [Pedobacter sp. N36a]
MKKVIVMLMLLLTVGRVIAQEEPKPYEGVPGWVETKDQRMKWFNDARFGMFIHWGLYSAAGGSWKGKQYPQHYAEWIQTWAQVPSKEYAEELKPKFTASKFNAADWAALAKEAGMKYMVITSRHHEGFSIFNSKQPYSLNNSITGGTNVSPKGRDLYGETVAAFKKEGLKIGAYYSLLDWQHPDSYDKFVANAPKENPNYEVYKDYLYGQIKELANNYGKMDILWLDFSSKNRQGETWGTKRILTDLIKWQPGILVNNRFWDGLENKNGDMGTPEKYVPPTGLPGMNWEVSHTTNESYGYSAHDKNWKSYDKMMRLFIETVSKGGNFLLNVGPDAEGVIPEPAVAILKQIGAWMKVNNEAVYGTTASPFQPLEWGYATQKAGKLYLEVFDAPKDGALEVPLSNTVAKAYILGAKGKTLAVKTTAKGKVVQLPADFSGPKPMVLVLEVKGAPKALNNRVSSLSDGRIVLTANQAQLTGNGGIKLKGASTHDPNRPNTIAFWTNKSDAAHWDMKVQRPGKYKVMVNYFENANTGGDLNIALEKNTLNYTLPSSETPGFKDVEAGVIDISQQAIGAESLRLQLKILTIKGQSMAEISSITLIPM